MAAAPLRTYHVEMSRGHPQRDEAMGLAIGLFVALVIHVLVLPGFGLYLESSSKDSAQKHKDGLELARLSRETKEKNRRLQFDIKDSAAEKPQHKRPEKKEDDTEPKRQVVSLPPPDKSVRPEVADYASEWDQQTERETRSRDQAQRMPSITRRKQTGALVGSNSPSPTRPGTAEESGGSAGPGRAPSGDSGSDATNGRGERMFAFALPKQAPREPLQLRAEDLRGVLQNRTAIPELPGNGDTARISMGTRPADSARRSGSGGQGEEVGQGLRGGGNGSSGLPSLEQLTPALRELERLAGAPANDYLPEVEVDAETRLNAWRWKHATFFNRVADAIRREWQGGEVLSSNDPAGRVYGFEDRLTLVQVTIDRSGNVLDINVTEASGAWVLDEEAVRAFKRAGPFANPPAQLFKGADKFTFLFGFNVAYNRQNFDLNWRPN